MLSNKIKSVLIANRGEIACRIIRTAKKLNIHTFAIYAESDKYSDHVKQADSAFSLGAGNVKETYLNKEKILALAIEHQIDAVHPGYGFLAEDEDFAAQIEAAGILFIGPTPKQIKMFGNKISALEIAKNSGIPTNSNSKALLEAKEAVELAEKIGYPVILKSAAGGGGIGIQVCYEKTEISTKFDSLKHVSEVSFGSGEIFLEKYVTSGRHIEVQIIGDGFGKVIPLSTRDCSLQRRNQKVIEEAPAANLTSAIVDKFCQAAVKLCESVNYRSVGTVEFIYDTNSQDFFFLEVNTRLQVEHTVTEEIMGFDLVELMFLTAVNELDLTQLAIKLSSKTSDSNPKHAIEARIYAEDTHKNFQGTTGLLTEVVFPTNIRVDTGVSRGSTVSPFYDPTLAKIISVADTRTAAIDKLLQALSETKIFGLETNIDFLLKILNLEEFKTATHTTKTIEKFFTTETQNSKLGSSNYQVGRIDVLRSGTMTTIQDLPGRIGYWNVGIPPSGPMDDKSFKLANYLVGNPNNTAAIEFTMQGAKLKFSAPTLIAITGAPTKITLNDNPINMWETILVPENSILDIGSTNTVGLRTYLAIAAGIQAPEYLGSKSCFPLGKIGGITSNSVKNGDVIKYSTLTEIELKTKKTQIVFDKTKIPTYTNNWLITVAPGPQSSPDYLTETGFNKLLEANWIVQNHVNRTGIRLNGPKPIFSREDGGDAGLHPSNLHDNPYSVGAINLSGDTPIILGPDGPSLGGFACPLTVISTERWKLGQIKPGDSIKFTLAKPETQSELIKISTEPILKEIPATINNPLIIYKQGADDNILIEYGSTELDLTLSMRAHLTTAALLKAKIPGIIDITPGIRSVHIHYDPKVISTTKLLNNLSTIDKNVVLDETATISSRIIKLPLAFNDSDTTIAIDRYQKSVRKTAPWLPSNLEFIRRINGLKNIDEIERIVFTAEYLVLGLGDVYLGAPLAVPLDPRHRLVTTKYNPARTWTAANAVGIGGKYLCIYSIESPGGYQLIGKTLPIWSGYKKTSLHSATKPWAFQFFDRISFFPVTETELAEISFKLLLGKYQPEIIPAEFSYQEYKNFLIKNQAEINAFNAKQAAAFSAEKIRWKTTGEFNTSTHNDETNWETTENIEIPANAKIIKSPIMGSIWNINVKVGDLIKPNDTVAILEAMKTEIPLLAEISGKISKILITPGELVTIDQPIFILE